MKIYYKDEYGDDLYVANNKDVAPRINETVVIDEIGYRVKNVTWIADSDYVVIELTESQARAPNEVKDNTSGRLAEMQRAIVNVTKRQDTTEKAGRRLTEQVVTMRKHINQRIQQERKES